MLNNSINNFPVRNPYPGSEFFIPKNSLNDVFPVNFPPHMHHMQVPLPGTIPNINIRPIIPPLNIPMGPPFPTYPPMHNLNSNHQDLSFATPKNNHLHSNTPIILNSPTNDRKDQLIEHLLKIDMMRNFKNKRELNHENRQNEIDVDKNKAMKNLIKTVDKINDNTLNYNYLNNSKRRIHSPFMMQYNERKNENVKYDNNRRDKSSKRESLYKNFLSGSLYNDNYDFNNYSNFKNLDKIGKYNIQDFILPPNTNVNNTR